jgi:SlyX protein
MADIEALNSRMDALEMRITHQDATIEDLNATITAQWREIDRLLRQAANLTERFQEMDSLGGLPGTPEPPPPHY